MKRLERLGSIAFLTIAIAFVFHLIAMSFNRWIDNICQNCNENYALGTWHTSLASRCYQAPVGSIFFPSNSAEFNIYKKSFIAEICLPNQFLAAKTPDSAYLCLTSALNYTHTICSVKNYDSNQCFCDYRSRTKLVLAMTVLTSLSLAALLVFSHIVSFSKLNHILRWLFPVCFILLICTIICIMVTLATFSVTRHDDINQLIYSSALLEDAFHNKTISADWNQYLENARKYQYKTKIGWCFGMEILSLQFVVVTLILYILMFMAKDRPEPKN